MQLNEGDSEVPGVPAHQELAVNVGWMEDWC